MRIIVDTTDPIFDQQPTTVITYVNAPITTTVYDAQVTNLNGGIVDEGITYRIKGTDADKFSITTDTGILTTQKKKHQCITTQLPLLLLMLQAIRWSNLLLYR